MILLHLEFSDASEQHCADGKHEKNIGVLVPSSQKYVVTTPHDLSICLKINQITSFGKSVKWPIMFYSTDL